MPDLNAIIAESIRVPVADIHDELQMQDVDTWDSLAHMEMIFGIESTYGIQLSSDEIVAMTRVASIREILSQKGVL